MIMMIADAINLVACLKSPGDQISEQDVSRVMMRVLKWPHHSCIQLKKKDDWNVANNGLGE